MISFILLLYRLYKYIYIYIYIYTYIGHGFNLHSESDLYSYSNFIFFCSVFTFHFAHWHIHTYIYIIKSEKICFQIFPVSHLNKENISLIEGCMHQTGFSLPMLLLGWSFLLLSFSTRRFLLLLYLLIMNDLFWFAYYFLNVFSLIPL